MKTKQELKDKGMKVIYLMETIKHHKSKLFPLVKLVDKELKLLLKQYKTAYKKDTKVSVLLDIFTLNHLNGVTYTEIAKRYNLSRGRIIQMDHEAIQVLENGIDLFDRKLRK